MAAACVVIVSVFLILNPAAASGKAMPGSFWDAGNEANTEEIDHSPWQRILDGYLQVKRGGINRFDYAALKANSRDRAILKSYLDYLQGIDPRLYSKAEQKAYWINLYNSLTVRLVVDAYPVNSIREVCEDRNPDSKCSGPWKEKHAKVAGRELTLTILKTISSAPSGKTASFTTDSAAQATAVPIF